MLVLDAKVRNRPRSRNDLRNVEDEDEHDDEDD